MTRFWLQLQRLMIAAAPVLHAGPLVLRLLWPSDAPALCRLVADKRIGAMTVGILHPYTQAHADSFIQYAQNEFAKGGSIIFAMVILSPDVGPSCSQADYADASSAEHGAYEPYDGAHAEPIGTIGLMRNPGRNEAELGYWVGVPCWGRGFAQVAAKATVELAFRVLQLAHVSAKRFASKCRLL